MTAVHQTNRDARLTAVAAMEKLPATATGLVEYHSGGQVLVIGDDQALEVARGLPSALQPHVLLLTGKGETDLPLTRAAGRAISLSGYLGHFRVKVGKEEVCERLEADMVIDLGPLPQIAAALKPPGYHFCSGTDRDELTVTVAQLAELTGTFDKPQYFEYDPSRCAHGRNGVVACTRCLDACPAQAITSSGDGVSVDPFLCQGGGVCATVCPSGAIRYAFPRPGDLLSRIRILLRSYREAGGLDPVVLFHAEQNPPLQLLESLPNLLPAAVEEVASVGPEVWFSALAYGARRVLLHDRFPVADSVTRGMEAQLATSREILDGMGFPVGAIERVGDDFRPGGEMMPPLEPAQHAAMNDKRTAWFLALDHLHVAAGRSRAVITLTAGAPFGAAFVEKRSCTLCMACVSACPGKALQDGRGEPRLEFIEANCIQCGLCTRTCPENAIWITPRLMLDSGARRLPRILHEEEPFCCVNCGRPFATRSMINGVLSKLSGHWMYQDDRSRRRVMMCEECRVADVVQDQEAMTKGQLPQ
ncbi:MAG: 4Fe-4S binding protein [Gammaproteobacteria bacterium]|nr:4Fe-4S binding protein [Gammaproteobacteria bacterium]